MLLSLLAVESEGALDPAAPDVVAPYVDVPVEWGGSVELLLPAELDGSAMEVTLQLSATPGGPATRIYSTTTPVPDYLTVADLGAGYHSVDLPDDTGDGPYGYLSFDAIAPWVDGVVQVAPVSYSLLFTGTGVSVVSLTTQVVAVGTSPCALTAVDSRPAYPVTPGSSFALTVPDDLLLRTLGLGSLATMQVVLQRLDGDGRPTEGAPLTLAAAAADPSARGLSRVLAACPRTAPPRPPARSSCPRPPGRSRRTGRTTPS